MACNLPLDLHISLSNERKCYLSQLIATLWPKIDHETAKEKPSASKN